MKTFYSVSLFALLCISMSASANATQNNTLIEKCKKAAPSLQCDALPEEELRALDRMCSDSKLTRTPWSGYAVGGKESRDANGKIIFSFDPLKQGSANGRTPCKEVQAYRYPRTEADVVEAVQEARIKGWGVKAVGAAHTDNELICGDGMAISNRMMNQILDLQEFEGEKTVRAQPGVTIRALGEWLHSQRYSVGYAVVGYEAVTLAGVVGTGAHGSAVDETAILSDAVQSMRMVMADGSVREFSKGTTGRKNPELWSALTLNLGLLGVITELRIRVRDEFQLEMVTTKHKDTPLFEDGQGILPYVEGCDMASLLWFPGRENDQGKETRSGRVIRNCGKAHYAENEPWESFSRRVDSGAQYILHAPAVNRFSYYVSKKLLHEGACDPSVLLSFEKIRRHYLVNHPPYARDHRLASALRMRSDRRHLKSHPKGIRGWSFAMLNSVGSPQSDEFRQADWEVALPAQKAPEVFRFLRNFFNGKDPSYNKVVPLQLIGLYVRFSKASETLLSHSSAGGEVKPGDRVMFLEIPEFLPYFEAHNEAEQRISDAIMAEYERPYRIFVEELIKRFGARVHWAKNRIEFFSTQIAVPDRHVQFGKFAAIAKQLDPQGLFSSSFSRTLFQSLENGPNSSSAGSSKPTQELSKVAF